MPFDLDLSSDGGLMKLRSNGQYMNRYGPVVCFADGTRARLVYRAGAHRMTYVRPLSRKVLHNINRRADRKGSNRAV